MVERARLAVVGTGIIGSSHVRDIGASRNAALAAICDLDAERARKVGAEHGVPSFTAHREMMEAVRPDGVIVATPHYFHPPVAIDAMQRGISVLCEKPVAVHAKEARRMNDAYVEARREHRNLVFAAMFQNRTLGVYAKLKQMIGGGALGRLIRTTWIVTDWLRSQAYYDNGGWRATWKGEGGGVLLNQCPHNLDLYQWLVGLPERVTGFAAIGKYHKIEVEDEVSAVFHHENGMVGHFVTSTGESPGTNRLEIIGENGKVVVEGGKLAFTRNEMSVIDFIRSTPELFARLPSQTEEVSFTSHAGTGHRLVIENFAAAIRDPVTPLIADGVDGIRSLSLGNAVMLSSWLGRSVDLPLDEDLYESLLMERIAVSRFQKPSRRSGVIADPGGSFKEKP